VLRVFEARRREVTIDLDQIVDLVSLDSVVTRPNALTEPRDDPPKPPPRFFMYFPTQRVERSFARIHVTAGYVPADREKHAIGAASMDENSGFVVNDERADCLDHDKMLATRLSGPTCRSSTQKARSSSEATAQGPAPVFGNDA
jgi:hypothetical protein